MAGSDSQVRDSLAAVLRLHSRNASACLSAERPASPGGAVFRGCARLDSRDRLGWKPNGELCVSPLRQGVLRELVLLQAAQAKLRPLQPDPVGERDAAAGCDRILAARLRRAVAAAPAGAARLLRIELLVHARHRVLAVVGYVADRLVKLGVALLAIPEKAIPLVGAPLALKHEEKRVGREARRVPHAGRAIDDLAFADERHLLRAFGREVVKVHLALDHVHDFVARIRMELVAVSAPACDEGDGVGRLPENAHRLDALPDTLGNLREADRLEFYHEPSRLP